MEEQIHTLLTMVLDTYVSVASHSRSFNLWKQLSVPSGQGPEWNVKSVRTQIKTENPVLFTEITSVIHPINHHFTGCETLAYSTFVELYKNYDCNISFSRWYSSKGKAVPLQVWSGPEGSRKLRFPDFMTTAHDGGKVDSLTHRPPLPLENVPGTHFCYRLSRPQGHSVTGRIMSLKNSNDSNGNRTRDLRWYSSTEI